MAKNPLYLNALYNLRIREERNKLLRTIKPARGENQWQLYKRIDGMAQAEAIKVFSRAEQAVLTRERFIAAEGLLIPGVETIAHWNYMTTKDKVVAVSADVASVLLILYGPKLISKAVRPLIKPFSRINRLVKLADKAGTGKTSGCII